VRQTDLPNDNGLNGLLARTAEHETVQNNPVPDSLSDLPDESITENGNEGWSKAKEDAEDAASRGNR
jgi:hypothetical protein